MSGNVVDTFVSALRVGFDWLGEHISILFAKAASGLTGLQWLGVAIGLAVCLVMGSVRSQVFKGLMWVGLIAGAGLLLFVFWRVGIGIFGG
jgi:hypothetical protein